jgi:hypothetical protein
MPIDENGQEIPDQPGDPSPAPDPGPVTIDPGTPADPGVDPVPVPDPVPTPTPTPTPTPGAGKTIGQVFKEKAGTAAQSDADTQAAIDADAKAKASQDADKAKDAEVAADLKAIGKPFVEEVDGGGFLIHYPTTKADGSPGYSSESGVGADTPVPAGADV